VEILKQGQYVPMPVEMQIISIFAASRGYLDDIAIDQVTKFEKDLHKFVEERRPELREEILKKGSIDSGLEAGIKKVIEEFKSGFNV